MGRNYLLWLTGQTNTAHEWWAWERCTHKMLVSINQSSVFEWMANSIHKALSKGQAHPTPAHQIEYFFFSIRTEKKSQREREWKVEGEKSAKLNSKSYPIRTSLLATHRHIVWKWKRKSTKYEIKRCHIVRLAMEKSQSWSMNSKGKLFLCDKNVLI